MAHMAYGVVSGELSIQLNYSLVYIIMEGERV